MPVTVADLRIANLAGTFQMTQDSLYCMCTVKTGLNFLYLFGLKCTIFEII